MQVAHEEMKERGASESAQNIPDVNSPDVNGPESIKVFKVHHREEIIAFKSTYAQFLYIDWERQKREIRWMAIVNMENFQIGEYQRVRDAQQLLSDVRES